MTKEFKCPVDGKEYSSAGALWYHKKKAHPGSVKSRGGRESGRRDASATVSQEDSVTPSTATPAADPSFYPPLQEWRQKRDEKSHAVEEKPITTGPAFQPAALNLSGLWKGLGDFIDDHMPKTSRVRVDMDDKKAAVLDEGLKQMGLVTLPAPTIVIPNWAPFLATAAAIFGIPLMVMAKEFVTSIRKDIKERREAAKPPPSPPPVSNPEVADRAAIHIVPSNPGPQPYHEPGTGG